MKYEVLRSRQQQETNLAAERTETKGIEETTATNLTSVGYSLSRPWLRPLIEKHNLSTVDNVGLNA